MASVRREILIEALRSDRINDDEAGLLRGIRVTAWKSAGAIVRAPRPFICSKYDAERTSRMKKTHSSGLTSVPVAIMSRVTAMRRLAEVRNACSNLWGSNTRFGRLNCGPGQARALRSRHASWP